MNTQLLIDSARAMVADDKGLLAMDESNPTCNKRFAKLGIPQTEEARRAYRELIITTPGLGESISGAIFYDETILVRVFVTIYRTLPVLRGRGVVMETSPKATECQNGIGSHTGPASDAPSS